MEISKWYITKNKDKHEYFHIYGKNSFGNQCPIANVCIAGDEEAHAKLIAAAPTLLAACRYVVKYHREHDSGAGELFSLDFVTTCIAAIGKATK